MIIIKCFCFVFSYRQEKKKSPQISWFFISTLYTPSSVSAILLTSAFFFFSFLLYDSSKRFFYFILYFSSPLMLFLFFQFIYIYVHFFSSSCYIFHRLSVIFFSFSLPYALCCAVLCVYLMWRYWSFDRMKKKKVSTTA